MKRIFTFLLAGALALSGCAAKPAEAQIFAMDTVMTLTAYGKGGQAALKQAEETIRELEAMLDRTDDGSEVYGVNGYAGKTVLVSRTLAELLRAAQGYTAATGGAFDVTVAPVMDAWGFTKDAQQVPDRSTLDALLPLVDSGRITVGDTTDGRFLVTLAEGQAVDLGGIAKGYVSDCVEAAFRQKGVASGMISLGGNVFTLGEKPDGTPWRVGVKDPGNTGGFACILSLTDAYAVTSGGYERYFEQNGQTYHHIIDPADGYPADSGLLSVTVVAGANGESSKENTVSPGNGAMCDAFSTALFVMGEEEALEFWRSGAYAFDLVLVTEDGRVLITDGLEGRVEEVKESGYDYEIIH